MEHGQRKRGKERVNSLKNRGLEEEGVRIGRSEGNEEDEEEAVKLDIEEENAERLSFKVAIPATIVAPNCECFFLCVLLTKKIREFLLFRHLNTIYLFSTKFKNIFFYYFLLNSILQDFFVFSKFKFILF